MINKPPALTHRPGLFHASMALPSLPGMPNFRPREGSPGVVPPPQELPLELRFQDLMRENCAVKSVISGAAGEYSVCVCMCVCGMYIANRDSGAHVTPPQFIFLFIYISSHHFAFAASNSWTFHYIF